MTHKGAICGMAAAALIASSPAMGNLVDAFGDAQDFGFGRPLLDIDTMFMLYDASFLHFEMTFHTPISAPSFGQPDGVAGFLEFDTDQNAATGLPPLQNFFSPPFDFLIAGIDFVVDLFSESFHPGFVDVIDTNFGIVDTVRITYGPMSFSGSIPLASLGGDDGILDFTTIIGTFDQPTDATDVVGKSKLIPAPATLALLGLGALVRRRRRG
ncbi:MAG: PEP-CTERM sorting domain-containing protein [Phycisphaerales bacterium]